MWHYAVWHSAAVTWAVDTAGGTQYWKASQETSPCPGAQVRYVPFNACVHGYPSHKTHSGQICNHRPDQAKCNNAAISIRNNKGITRLVALHCSCSGRLLGPGGWNSAGTQVFPASDLAFLVLPLQVQ